MQQNLSNKINQKLTHVRFDPSQRLFYLFIYLFIIIHFIIIILLNYFFK